jgi:hypothetical protein
MKPIKRLTNTVNRLRGVKINHVDYHDDKCIVCLNCECSESLMILANFFAVGVSSEDFEPVHYHVILEKRAAKYIARDLKDFIDECPELDEQLSGIDNYKLLDNNGRKKYFNFIKALRVIGLDGFFLQSAQELLDSNRHCAKCSKAIFTKEDEMNVVLEFDCPFDAIDKLNSIQCESENDMKSAEVHLGYFKQGDDMRHCLDESDGNVVSALKMRKEGLEATVIHLEALSQAIEDTGRASEFSMDADTHMIMLEGPDELIDMLIEKELVEESPFDDEDFEE